MATTHFQAFWHGMCGDRQGEWVRRSIWALAKALEKTFWSKALLESADDIVMHTLERLLLDPTGEYAPRGEGAPEEYFRRCLWMRVWAVHRMASAAKRQFVGPNHNELEEGKGHFAPVRETPETLLEEREARQKAQEAIVRAIGNSRFRGIPREYAENFVEFAAQGLSTADIAKRFNTSEGNVRSARLKFMRLLVREGIIQESALRGDTIDGEAVENQDTLVAPVPTKQRH
jgi:DNA-directed RNA polymerase specialized sigma24 family protein